MFSFNGLLANPMQQQFPTQQAPMSMPMGGMPPYPQQQVTGGLLGGFRNPGPIRPNETGYLRPQQPVFHNPGPIRPNETGYLRPQYPGMPR